MEQEQGKINVNSGSSSPDVCKIRSFKPKKNHCLLIALICGFVFVILMFFIVLPFIITRLDAYMNVVASSNSSKTPTVITSPKPRTNKKPVEADVYEIKKCEPVQTSNPDPLNISVEDPVFSKQSSDIYYDIYGSTLNEIRAQLMSCGPKYEGESFAGMTTHYINWNYLMRFDASGTCHVENAAVGVNVKIYYPKWDAPEISSQETRGIWDNMISNLRTHEEGHRQIDYDGGEKLYNTISPVSASSCNEVESIVKDKTSSIVDEISQNNQNYDAQTNHGDTQGAHF